MSSKLSRKVLKGIVKECMIEIMEESFFPNHSNSMMQERLERHKSKEVNENQYRNQDSNKQDQRLDRHSYLDNISYANKKDQNKRGNFEKKVENITNTMTSDPILAGILKDTALTTLQEQASAESNKNSMPLPAGRGDAAARAVSQTSPDQIFGQESANKWAALAFSDNKLGR